VSGAPSIAPVVGGLKVSQLMDQAFFPGRAPRSAAYQEGCRAALEHRIQGRRMYLPYPTGTSEADAWFAGVQEGHCIGRKLYDTLQDS